MFRRLSSGVVALAVAILAVESVSLAHAQDRPEASDADLLKDFIHYVNIDQTAAAAGVGQELLARGLTDIEFVDLVKEADSVDRFQNALPRALKKAGLEAIAAQMISAFERGNLARVRMPEEIAANIGLLTGNRPGWFQGRTRLIEAGEYAVPQLLEAFLSSNDPMLETEIHNVLRDMGRQCITPLITALPELDGVDQERVIGVLQGVPYRTSLPVLYDIKAGTGSEPVAKACAAAIGRIDPSPTVTSPAELYMLLAEGYYAEKSELTSFPAEEVQLLWFYDPTIGLYAQPIRTEVFHEAMAMRAAERSLELRPEDPLTLALWIAANYSREIDSPEEYENPAYPPDRREAEYFAVAAGSGITQRVLARGLDTSDTPLVRLAISAIQQTAGGAALRSGPAGRQPLVEALAYPNRRVQYEAALALAASRPAEAFDGGERVVPILASAIREADEKYAVIVAERERYEGLRRILQDQGYTVLPSGQTLQELAAPIAEAPGIDLIVSSLPQAQTQELIEQIQARPSLSAVPVLALTSTQGYLELSQRFARDVRIAVRQTALSDEQLVAAVDRLIEVASGGPITEEEARAYATRALGALRDLAISGVGAFDVADAATPLIGALGDAAGQVRNAIADVLSRIGRPEAQQALMDAALAASGGQRIALLDAVAVSAKRFGGMLEQRQIDRLIELAQSGDEAEATAGAALMGALNLPNEQLIPLILGGE